MIARSEIDEHFAIVKRMFRDGQLPKDKYLKCCVALACEHAVLDQMEDARLILAECDERYTQEVLPVQMAEDAAFHTLALYVARKLSDRGVPEVSQDELLLSFTNAGKA